MSSVYLSAAIDEYISSREPVYARMTVEGDRQSLTYFLTAVGNIQTGNLETRHGEEYMAWLGKKKLQSSTLCNHHMRVCAFVSWLRARKYIRPSDNPMATTRRPKISKKVHQRVPAAEFGKLLGAGWTPRHRIVCALGLYVFLRASEVKVLRLDDVSLADDRLLVRQPKTGKEDEMPICAELGDEFRRWLTHYHAQAPLPLTGQDFLVPGMTAPRRTGTPTGLVTVESPRYRPEIPVAKPARMVQQALRAAGYDTRDAWGKSLYEGVHTLRRSGARALFDHLVEGGYDGAMRTVQAMLHHEHSSMTERYLGIDLDIKKRDALLRGRAMFEQPSNVVSLEVAR